jgi:hypothetical protein
LEAIVDAAAVIAAKFKTMDTSDVDPLVKEMVDKAPFGDQMERSIANLKVSVSTLFLYITALYPQLHKSSEKLKKVESEALEMMFKRLLGGNR